MSGYNWKGDGNWSPWYLLLWGCWVIMFFVLEFIALFDNNDATPTFTETVTRFIPGFLVFMGVGWLIWHVIASYNQHKLLGQDDEQKPPEEDSDG